MVKTQNATTIDEMALFSSGCYAECDEGCVLAWTAATAADHHLSFERQTTSTGSTTCCQVGQSCVDETSASGSASATGADTDDTTDAADGDAKWSTFAGAFRHFKRWNHELKVGRQLFSVSALPFSYRITQLVVVCGATPRCPLL